MTMTPEIENIVRLIEKSLAAGEEFVDRYDQVIELLVQGKNQGWAPHDVLMDLENNRLDSAVDIWRAAYWKQRQATAQGQTAKEDNAVAAAPPPPVEAP